MASSHFSEPHNPNISAEQPWVDSTLSLYDSDIEFKSSDGFIFQLHRSVLIGFGAFPFPGSFPGPDGSDSNSLVADGEIITLTEPANVLAVLFAFLYPKPRPDLHGMEFELLLAVAEAAAKYQVFSAVDGCNERLVKFLPKHAPAILDHAVKHDYQRLLSETIPHFVPGPLLETMQRLKPQYMIPFVQYHEAWRTIFKDLTKLVLSYRSTEDVYHSQCDPSSATPTSTSTICPSCAGGLLVSIGYLESIPDPARLRALFRSPSTSTSDPDFAKVTWCCNGNSNSRSGSGGGKGALCPFLENILKLCEEKVDKLPSFATFLGLKV